MTVIMTIVVFGKNTSSPVTCLDLLCCANSCRAFSKKNPKNHICMLTPLSCPTCSVLVIRGLEHRVTGECTGLPVMMAARLISGKPGLMKALEVSS